MTSKSGVKKGQPRLNTGDVAALEYLVWGKAAPGLILTQRLLGGGGGGGLLVLWRL